MTNDLKKWLNKKESSKEIVTDSLIQKYKACLSADVDAMKDVVSNLYAPLTMKLDQLQSGVDAICLFFIIMIIIYLCIFFV